MSSIPSVESGASTIKNIIFNKKFIIILFVVTIFLAVAFYVYNTYIAPKIDPDYVPNREFTDTSSDSESAADLYFFSAKWCPYSKKAKPIWANLKKQFDNKSINNTKLRFIDIDEEKDEKEMENFETKFLNGKKIDGFPSIYMIKNDQVIEYEAKPNLEILKNFIESVL